MPSLLHRIQYDNDETAFQEFYKENVFKLFQFAFAFVRNEELAEEIVNDVFLRLWQKRNALDKIDNLNVYLYVAVKNTAANYIRKDIRRKQPEIDNLTVSHFYLSPDPEQVMITDELRKTIEHSVNQLPPKCKLIFKLVKEDGLSGNEVAAILRLSYKTVNAQLAIALKKLEQDLRPSLQEYHLKVRRH